jgi:hypothetical protein
MLTIQTLQNLDRKTIIHCPHCRAEYLPGEIYMPGALIGQPPEIIKDSFGKIIYVDYQTQERAPDTLESFICEYCEKPFIVEASIAYKSREEAPENDFTTKYVSLLD